MSWILRNSRFLRVTRAMSWVSFLYFSRQPQAHQAAVLEIQLLEQLQAPCFTVAGKRQKACGGTELTVSKGHAAHTSPLGEAPTAGNEAAVIHCGPRAVWGHNHRCLGRGNAYINLTITGTGCDWRDSACCMPPGGTRRYGGQRYEGSWWQLCSMKYVGRQPSAEIHVVSHCSVWSPRTVLLLDGDEARKLEKAKETLNSFAAL